MSEEQVIKVAMTHGVLVYALNYLRGEDFAVVKPAIVTLRRAGVPYEALDKALAQVFNVRVQTGTCGSCKHIHRSGWGGLVYHDDAETPHTCAMLNVDVDASTHVCDAYEPQR